MDRPSGPSRNSQGLLPLLNSQAVDLLDNERLVSQLVSLERRTTRGGRDSIDHLPGAHDDLANAAADALVTVFSDWATQKQRRAREISPLPSANRDAGGGDSSGSCLGNGQLSHAHR